MSVGHILEGLWGNEEKKLSDPFGPNSTLIHTVKQNYPNDDVDGYMFFILKQMSLPAAGGYVRLLLTVKVTLLWPVVVVGDGGARGCTSQGWTRFSKGGKREAAGWHAHSFLRIGLTLPNLQEGHEDQIRLWGWKWSGNTRCYRNVLCIFNLGICIMII